ncbi:hypothetical protein [Legionella brunensis]|uniref:Uncharacterized protein n=1 Tax=Legionella brunensis TaxID=29422 RepID=A0A0W0SUA7_9GAMM|nr:hypothetical protein [Legionella brunensis]KTC86533.1 hypothetical protein Lbru_0474 [Legionella brunensis]
MKFDWGTIIAVISAIIAIISAYFSKKANSLAAEANQLSVMNAEFSKDLNKMKETKSIIEAIASDWNKSRHILLTEWKFYQKRGFTKEEFNDIWELACYKKKVELLEKHSNKFLINITRCQNNIKCLK